MAERELERTLIRDLPAHVGSTVRVCGWVHAVRDQKKVQFVIIRDPTGLVQVVHRRLEGEDPLAEQISHLTAESAVELHGALTAEERVRLGGVEIQLERLDVVGLAEQELPIDSSTALDKRLDWRFLDLRRPENHLIFRVQTTAEWAMREFWRDHDFIEIHSPKLMATASESGAELFKVEYFDRQAYLAQSPQFYKQMAMAAGFERVFEIAPVFRANPSFTSRHDTEFTSVDVELSWITSHEDVMRFEERWLAHVLSRMAEQHGDELSEVLGVEIKVPQLPFPRVTLAEAREIVERSGYTTPDKGDLDPEGERRLAAYIEKEHDHEFVFVTDYPIEVRPFYHMRQEGDRSLTNSFDLIWRGLEVTTGAQREHRYDRLAEQALGKGIGLDSISYYLDFFRFGCPPHGGFGFGLTRMLMVMLGLRNVREVTFLYRGPNRLTP
jgi:aspartyl-tRNA synthetase